MPRRSRRLELDRSSTIEGSPSSLRTPANGRGPSGSMPTGSVRFSGSMPCEGQALRSRPTTTNEYSTTLEFRSAGSRAGCFAPAAAAWTDAGQAMRCPSNRRSVKTPAVATGSWCPCGSSWSVATDISMTWTGATGRTARQKIPSNGNAGQKRSGSGLVGVKAAAWRRLRCGAKRARRQERSMASRAPAPGPRSECDAEANSRGRSRASHVMPNPSSSRRAHPTFTSRSSDPPSTFRRGPTPTSIRQRERSYERTATISLSLTDSQKGIPSTPAWFP